MGYRNPTLTEILAEIHLAEGTLSEKNLIVLAREVAAMGLDEMEFIQALTLVQIVNQDSSEQRLVPRIRCWDRERIKLIQISPDAVFANLIGEYPGWDTFLKHVQATRESISKALRTRPQIIRVDLTTIDKWKVGLEHFTIGQYLNCDGQIIPKWYADVSVSADIRLGQGVPSKDGFNKRVHVSVRTSNDSVQFQIHTTIAMTNQRSNFNDLMEILHIDSLQLFEALITDKVRNEIMGGRQ